MKKYDENYENYERNKPNEQPRGLAETRFHNGRLSLELDDSESFDDSELSDEPSTDQPARAIENAGVLLHDNATRLVKRKDLLFLPVPPATDSFQPVPHNELIDRLEETLSFRHLLIKDAEFAVSADGMKLFGLLEINAEMDGIRFAIGLRNSNDKSMRLGMVAGYKVTVCSNMMLAGDFHPLLAKHTPGFSLTDSLSVAVDRIHRGFEPLREMIEIKRLVLLSDDEARTLIYRAFLEENFPISLIKKVHQNYFDASYEEFRDHSLWALENAFTESFKNLQPLSQYQTTAKFGRFWQPLLESEDKAEADSEKNDLDLAHSFQPPDYLQEAVQTVTAEVAMR